MNLEKARKQIDEIDEKITRLLAQRFELARETGKEKLKKGGLVEDPLREKEVLERVEKTAEKLGLLKAVALRIFEEIIAASKSQQMMDHKHVASAELHVKKVAFQGERGAYSEEALKQFLPKTEPVPCRELADVFEAVRNGRADAGLVPIENSTEGSINTTYDLLLNSGLTIIGETFLRVRHCLLGLNELNKIRRVYSHPQALAQCRRFLQENALEPVEFYDTAGAAAYIKKEGLLHAGAIASKTAAEYYVLNVMQEGIEDNRNNYTRFVLVCKIAQLKGDKTSIVFSTQHKPGALFKVLKVFADAGINLTKIESRPTKQKPWEYIFYLDFEGSAFGGKGQKALEEIKPHTLFLKVLGSYPRG